MSGPRSVGGSESKAFGGCGTEFPVLGYCTHGKGVGSGRLNSFRTQAFHTTAMLVSRQSNGPSASPRCYSTAKPAGRPGPTEHVTGG